MAKILVVEGAPPAMRLLLWALGEEGVPVDVCGLEEAPGHAAADPPEVIVVNAAMLPAERGAVFEALRTAVPGVKIVDLALAADDVEADPPADDRILPPYRVDELLRAIAALSPPG